jgi:hypothetical protein
MDPIPFVDVLSTYVGIAWKLAVMTILLIIRILMGFVVPLSSPVHPEKYQPSLGRAVAVTTEFAG